MHKDNRKWAIDNLKFLARYVRLLIAHFLLSLCIYCKKYFSYSLIFSYSLLHEAAPIMIRFLAFLFSSHFYPSRTSFTFTCGLDILFPSNQNIHISLFSLFFLGFKPFNLKILLKSIN